MSTIEDLVEMALSDYCMACKGTGRDAFSEGALWCGACGGTGRREDQIRRAEDMEYVNKRLEEKKKKD